MPKSKKSKGKQMKKIFKILSIFAACSFTPTVAAEDIEVYEINILEYGEFKAYSVKEKYAENTLLGKMTVLKEIELLKQTDTIDGSIGTQFGVKYFVKGLPKGANVPLSVRLLHPITTDPDTQQTSMIEEWIAKAKIGSANYSGWIFEYKWEIVQGEWTILISYNGKKLAEKKFTVQIK